MIVAQSSHSVGSSPSIHVGPRGLWTGEGTGSTQRTHFAQHTARNSVLSFEYRRPGLIDLRISPVSARPRPHDAGLRADRHRSKPLWGVVDVLQRAVAPLQVR